MRNFGTGTKIEKMIYSGLADSCRDDFLHRIDEEKKAWLFKQLDSLPKVIAARKQAEELYKKQLADCGIPAYDYAEDAVPWRYNMLVNNTLRTAIINACLKESLPVSDWYPRVTSLFGDNGEYPGAELHERMILNFPLLLDVETIKQICSVVRLTVSSMALEV